MKKFLTSRTAKILFTFSMLALFALPVLAKTNSDGVNSVDGAMSPAAVVGAVALIIGLVVALAAKGSNRIAVKK